MTQTIPELRAAIDAIDEKLIALLNERSQFVKQVGAIKKNTQPKGNSFIRSGREADMVRRMLKAFEGGTFPPAAAAHMWRIIISASLSLESPLTVAAYAPQDAQEIYWHAREYFGNFTPTSKKTSVQDVLDAVSNGNAQVGVLPLPDASAEGKWWLALPEDIKIFACIPFILPKGNTITAVAVAKVEPEDTGDDVSFFSFAIQNQSKIGTILDKHKLNTRRLAQSDGTCLLEIKGFINVQHDAIVELQASSLAIRYLGAYAMPITL